MKVFISQPMRGKTNEEIKAERERLIGKAREHYGADIEVVDSFFEGAPADARPLWFLGEIAGTDEHGGCGRVCAGLGGRQRVPYREYGRYPVRSGGAGGV